MAKLDFLAQALRSGAQGKADLAGLNERYERANTMRDAPIAEIDQYGQTSPLAAMAGMLRNSRGRRDVRDIEPQRTAARQSVAESANVMPMYNAEVAADKVAQDQANFDTTTGLNRARNAEIARTNKANQALKQAQFEQKKGEAGNIVELVNQADPQNSLMVGKIGAQYYDANTGEPFNATGFTEKPKNARSSGSRYTRSKSEDPYGNDVITIFDKNVGEEQIASFGDGTPYTPELAAERGGQRAAQKGAEAGAKEDVKIDLQAAETAGEKLKSLHALQAQMKKGLQAFDEGAETGPISQYLPSVRASTIKLENVVDNLALSDIGNYSFGALSEAEGNWLRAANLPMGLNEDEGRAWLQKRYEATQRMIRSTTYEQDMRAAGHKPDRKVIDQILYNGGFTFED